MFTQSNNGETVAPLDGVTRSVIDPATGAASLEELSVGKSVWMQVGAP